MHRTRWPFLSFAVVLAALAAQSQNEARLVAGTVGAQADLRTRAVQLRKSQRIVVVTNASRTSPLDVFIYSERTHELAARSDEDSREPFEWTVIDSGGYYFVVRNITDAPVSFEIQSSVSRGDYYDLPSPEKGPLGPSATTAPTYALVKVFYATDRATLKGLGSMSVSFSGEPADELQLGMCTVSVPRDHRMGELEGPSILRLEFHQDPAKHIVLVDTTVEQIGSFFRSVSDRAMHSKLKEAFVFVHGFNTDFESAARRTAQLAYDLAFEGAPILYSWPSQGSLLGYNKDLRNAELSVSHFQDFLSRLASQPGIERVHVIAHSLGNRVVVQALASQADAHRRIHIQQVALVAPDIDAQQFRLLAAALKQDAGRVTLYASSKDKALKASELVQGYPRAGEGEPNLVVIPGIDTIDASAVDTSGLAWSHSYFADNRSILSDLFYLMRGNSAGERACLRARQRADGSYWAFVPAVR